MRIRIPEECIQRADGTLLFYDDDSFYEVRRVETSDITPPEMSQLIRVIGDALKKMLNDGGPS